MGKETSRKTCFIKVGPNGPYFNLLKATPLTLTVISVLTTTTYNGRPEGRPNVSNIFARVVELLTTAACLCPNTNPATVYLKNKYVTIEASAITIVFRLNTQKDISKVGTSVTNMLHTPPRISLLLRIRGDKDITNPPVTRPLNHPPVPCVWTTLFIPFPFKWTQLNTG